MYLKKSRGFLSVALITLAALSLIKCRSTSANSSAPREVIGEDDRQPELDEKVLEVVGLLSGPNTICSAFFVEQNVIVSAAHCIDPQVSELSSLSFKSGLGQIYKLKSLKNYEEKKDLVFFEVDRKSSKYLPLGSSKNQRVALVSYDLDSKSFQRQNNCKISERDQKAGILFHSCDSKPGASGSPLIENGVAVGVHLGYSSERKQNVAFDLDHLKDNSSDLSQLDFLKERPGDNWRKKFEKAARKGVGNIIDLADGQKGINFGNCEKRFVVSVALAAGCYAALNAIGADCFGPQAGIACAPTVAVAAAACGQSEEYIRKSLEECN